MITGRPRAHLPVPEFFQDGDQFAHRPWLTADLFADMRLSQRQAALLPLLRQQHGIITAEYQEATGASRATAKRDLEDLVAKGLLVPEGARRGAHYELARKRLPSGSIGSSRPDEPNGPGAARTARRRRPRTVRGLRAPGAKRRKK